MELVTQTAKGRIYRTDSAHDAIGLAALFGGSFTWYLDHWAIIIDDTRKNVARPCVSENFGYLRSSANNQH